MLCTAWEKDKVTLNAGCALDITWTEQNMLCRYKWSLTLSFHGLGIVFLRMYLELPLNIINFPMHTWPWVMMEAPMTTVPRSLYIVQTCSLDLVVRYLFYM